MRSLKQGIAQTVDPFEMLEKQDQALQMRGGQLAVDAVKRVSDGVRQRLLLQEGLKVENVVAKAADLGVLRLRKSPDKEVNFARILRKISRNLLAYKSIRQCRNRQTSLDGVVVGDGNKVHPRRLGAPVQLERIGVAIGKIKPAEEPVFRSITELRMKVEIAAAHWSSRAERSAVDGSRCMIGERPGGLLIPRDPSTAFGVTASKSR